MARLWDGVTTTEKVTLDGGFGTPIANLAQITLAAWVYRTGVGANQRLIFGHALDNSLGIIAGGTASRFIAARWGTTAGEWRWAVPTLNTWEHHVLTYDYGATANNAQAYVNGVAVTTTRQVAPAGTVADVSQAFAIGNDPFDGNQWPGALCELATWSRVLSASEVAAIYAGGANAAPSGLAMYLPLCGTASPEPNRADATRNGTVTGTTLTAHPAISGSECVAAPGQTIAPNATIAAGGWVDQLGGSTNLHGPLADESAATYVQSPANPSGQILKLGLEDPLPPGAGDIVIEIDAEQV